MKPRLPQTWIYSSPREILFRREERIEPHKYPEQEFVYVGLENIASHSGQLLHVSSLSGRELLSTKNMFYNGDILYGKLRPYLNKVYLAEIDGVCSTDIWVFNPSSLVDAEYISFYLRSERIVQQVGRVATGANLPRIAPSFFDTLPIPLPPISEQRRIAEILREADAIRKLRQQANERAQQLLPALFQEMFGDPVENPMRWQQKPLGNYIVFLTSGSRGWAKYYASKGAKFIRVQDLAGLGLDLSHASCVIPPETSEARRAKIKPGDLLFSITGVIGQVAVAPYDIGDAYVSQHVAIVRLQEEVLNPTFVSAFLAHKTGGQMQIHRGQYGQTKPGFGLQDIEALQIFLPPKELQDDFASKVSEIRQLEMRHENSCQHIDNLFQSLLARAFTGELTAAWREEHAEMLSMEALERDLMLKGRSTPRTPEPGVAAAEMDMQAREVLVADMSNEQQRMLQAVLATDGYMTTPPPLQNGFSPLSPRLQRQGLELLAATGVVAQVSMPIRPDGTVTFYPTAYRRLLPDDDSRDDDLQALEEQYS